MKSNLKLTKKKQNNLVCLLLRFAPVLTKYYHYYKYYKGMKCAIEEVGTKLLPIEFEHRTHD